MSCRTRLLVVGLAAGAALAAAGPAGAAPAPAAGPVSHPDTDRMGSTVAAHEGAGPGAAAAPAEATSPTRVRGHDVSHWQGSIDWPAVRAAGAQFVYVKATESTTYTDPQFRTNYTRAYAAGLVRGAYHFALPDRSSGAAQADWFVEHGGGWSADGRTLPPLLDIEYNPYGPTCYGLSRTQTVRWLKAFRDRVHLRTGRYPAIYTTTDWWRTCTGDATGFARDPLFLARWSTSVGTLPASWTTWTFWQYADSGPLPGDQDLFRGSPDRLRAVATGS
jgi:GH25 family lysozyme M1 (1,4-beta-N-acetylmuramidase)